MQDHDHDDNDDHFPDVEGEVPDKRHGEERLADNPLVLDGFRCTDPGIGDELVRGRVVVAPRDVPVMGGGVFGPEGAAADLRQRRCIRCIHHRPVNDRVDRGQPIGLVDDHVTISIVFRDIRLLCLLPGHELPEPVLLDNHDEVPDIHVGHHAPGFYRDNRGPCAADEVEAQGNGADNADDPEEVAGKRDGPVVTGTELGDKRSYIPGFFFLCHGVPAFTGFCIVLNPAHINHTGCTCAGTPGQRGMRTLER